MVTWARKRTNRRLFLKEHREAKGVSAEEMAEWLKIERESVYRLERHAYTRMNPKKLDAYAARLELEPEELWRPPGAVSLDAIAAAVPEDLKGLATEVAADALRRFVAGRR